MPQIMGEFGRIGQRRFGGIFSEEFLRELQGKHGIESYREMSDNDDVCGAIIFVIEMLIRQAMWTVAPGGDSAKDKEAAQFVEGCMADMQDTWTDTLSEILSFLPFGWSYHEIVYKRRMGDSRDPRLKSKFSDGMIGWQKLPIRAQETLLRWEYDENDNLTGMTQLPPPHYQMATIPITKALHFRTKSRKNNPEGRSILRSAYRSWYFKRRIQEIEGIGLERDLAGLPILKPGPNVNIWNQDDPTMVQYFERAQQIVRNVRRDATEGLVLPNEWDFQLLTSGGRRQFDTSAIIERYDTRIAMSVLCDFILLGHQKVGSYALSDNKTDIFSMALGAYQDMICEAFNNQAIPRLMSLNADHFQGITDYPKLQHSTVEAPNLKDLAAFIKDLTSVGVIIPDDALEAHVREVGKLPERTEDQQFDRKAREGKNNQQETGSVDLDEDKQQQAEAEEAKKRLGR